MKLEGKLGKLSFFVVSLFIMVVLRNLSSFYHRQQTGDFLYSAMNWHVSVLTAYHSGQSLDNVQNSIEDYITTMQSRNGRVFEGVPILLFHQARVLKEGLHALDTKPSNNIPSEEEALQQFSGPLFLTNYKIHQLTRAYLFCRLDDAQSLDIVDILSDISENKHQLRPNLLFGIFYEGLASFLLARQTKDSEQRARWIEKGENVLTKMKYWSEHSPWNWESKMLLLEAEKMNTMGNFDQGSRFYERALRSAREHKFINDEAIASELSGTFFCERGLSVAAEALLLHSVHCYKTWGALAVARRVETYIANKYGTDTVHQKPDSEILASIFAACNGDSSKKRQEAG